MLYNIFINPDRIRDAQICVNTDAELEDIELNDGSADLDGDWMDFINPMYICTVEAVSKEEALTLAQRTEEYNHMKPDIPTDVLEAHEAKPSKIFYTTTEQERIDLIEKLCKYLYKKQELVPELTGVDPCCYMASRKEFEETLRVFLRRVSNEDMKAFLAKYYRKRKKEEI